MASQVLEACQLCLADGSGSSARTALQEPPAESGALRQEPSKLPKHSASSPSGSGFPPFIVCGAHTQLASVLPQRPPALSARRPRDAWASARPQAPFPACRQGAWARGQGLALNAEKGQALLRQPAAFAWPFSRPKPWEACHPARQSRQLAEGGDLQGKKKRILREGDKPRRMLGGSGKRRQRPAPLSPQIA